MPIRAAKSPSQNFSPAPPSGFSGRKKRDSSSEYKKSLKEKQALKEIYGLSEKQLKMYVKKVFGKIYQSVNLSDELVKLLEKRLDSVVLRLGFAKTHKQARQLVTHGYFKVNGKPVDIPSFQVKKGDEILLKENKRKKLIFENLTTTLEKAQLPKWLTSSSKDFKGTVNGEPSLAEVNLPIEISLVFEFYSK